MFLVLALPRSRTYWLSKFLSYGDYECGHDGLRYLRSMEDVRIWLAQDHAGSCETAGAPWWRLIPEDMPVVVVRRPVSEVVDSLLKIDLEGIGGYDRPDLTRRMEKLDAKLDQIEARRKVLSVSYDSLSTEKTCKRVFEHCLPYEFDDKWWASMAVRNLQCNMRAMVRYGEANRGQFAKIQCAAKRATISAMIQRPARDLEGVMIQQEPFEKFLVEGTHLFPEHAAEVGESEDTHETKNIPLMRKLANAGALQITTARCNGRMFGYLMAAIYPSLESPGITCGQHLLFFASKEFPGLGLRLQRASASALKERGVTEIYLRAGIRGSGPGLGTIYRRMGAESFGEMFKLKLEAA